MAHSHRSVRTHNSRLHAVPAAPARTPTPSPSICVSWESFLGPAGEGVLTFVLWAQSQVISLDCRCHLSSAPVQPGAAQSQSALAGLQPLTHSNLVLPSEVKYRMEGAGGTPGPRPTPALLVSPSITFRLSADLTVLTATGRGPPPPRFPILLPANPHVTVGRHA